MNPSVRAQARTGAILIGVTILLWLLALLFLLRIVNIFDAYLMKFPGPLVIFGWMLLGPLAAAAIGFRLRAYEKTSLLSRIFIGLGGFLVIAFVVVIGFPLLADALSPAIPTNPSTPRSYVETSELPVFPGAEGFGTKTRAGRGGVVLEVTSLEDSGPGTLREALNLAAPRIIVFRVAGIIELESELYISQPYVTVAGQTAPGDGITIKGAGLIVTSHDVLIQHLRIRPGNEGPVNADVNDAVSLLGKHGDIEDGASNVVLDHISASWSEDETVSTWYGAHDITISWSIISEALDRSRHRKETHSAGLLIGDSSYNVSLHHNLLAHNDFRNPLISGGGTHDFVNNVIYDWGVLAGEIQDFNSNTFLNFVGNLYIPGPSTVAGPYELLFTEGDPRIYVEGNLGPHRPDASMDEWRLVGFGYGEEGVAPDLYQSLERFSAPAIATTDAGQAREQVLAGAGATAPLRDLIDQRLVQEVESGTGMIIDSPSEVGGYPQHESGSPATDSDHDGMPDEWELAFGLDPLNTADGNGDLDGDGYTNVEEYLHSLLPSD
jgi:pectate lyase